MTDLHYVVGFSLSGALLVMMLFGIGLSAFMPTLDRWSRRYFVALFSMFFLCTITCFLALIYWNDPTKAVAARITYFFESFFLCAPIFMPIFFLVHHCGEDLKSSLLFKLECALLGIYVALLIVGQFTTAFYYVTDDNQFVRGPLWALWLVPIALMLLLNIITLIKRRNQLSKKYFFVLLIYLIPMTASIFIHMFVQVEIFIVFGMALLALVMFILILRDNVEKYTRGQSEIARQHAGIMVLQMRPHFIYNTMMTIYYLCKQDADKAQQVTLDFTTYLRKNFTAIAREEAVPFQEELKHTQAYLAVEQAQHEDNLFVTFDTPHTNFRVPPLTLQPLVENAVKHGMDPNGEPLHIYVKTRETDSGSEIIVENDGPDFNPADDNEPHIALANIRERLKMMCEGTLEIAPREGGGTVVTVVIPQ
ncbi:MAG: histidine kinase [Clostridia bacterium]|nr:histidine kinase [Clostridia bacterium]